MKKPILIGFFLAFAFAKQALIALEASMELIGRFLRGPLKVKNLSNLPALGVEWKDRLTFHEIFGVVGKKAFFFLAPGANSFHVRGESSSPELSPKGAEVLDLPMFLWVPAAVVFIVLLLLLLVQSLKRKAANDQLKQARLKYKALFNRSPCGYYSIDDRGYFVNINKTLLRWLGYEREEILGKLRFSDLIDSSDVDLVDKAILLVRRKSTLKAGFNFVRKSGEEFPVVLTILQSGGKVVYCVLDNTECKQALSRVKNLDQELESFSYSISHDLRAPLRSIDGYSKILLEDYAGKLDDEGKRVLKVIMANAKRMGKLIDDLLDFGRLGRKDIHRSDVDMTGLIRNIVQELLLQEPDRKIEVKVDDLHTAAADPEMMRQVWFNLIENAVKFTGKKDRAIIEVRSFKTGSGEIRYEIEDNGVGFDMKYAPKLFGVFQRLHKIQDFSGTGVGLAIVKRIVSRHDGRVWAEATPDKGAIFYFTIPVDQEYA